MSSIKTILAPIDFSEASINALRYAVALARQFNAKLYIFHAYHVEIPAYNSTLFPGAEAAMYLDELERNMKENIQKKFNSLEKELFISNIPAREFISLEGFVEDLIQSFVQQNEIDVVVMTPSESRSVLNFFSSHVTNLVNKLDTPILVVPPKARYRKIKDIVFANDFGDVSEKIDVLVEIAKLNNAELLIFNNETGYEEESIDVVATASKLNHVLKSIPHKYHKEYFEYVDEGILHYIQNNKVDLLVLVPRHHDFLERIFKKSITKDLIFHATVPLLIIPE
jgi:nucleotide-binding universal stress UspA family protein